MKSILGGFGLLFGFITICIVITACDEAEQMDEVIAWLPYKVPHDVLPEGFTTGRHASPERIAKWNIDIRPDGEGLPPGSAVAPDGADIYLVKCMLCHGMAGKGGKMGQPMAGPPLVGVWNYKELGSAVPTDMFSQIIGDSNIRNQLQSSLTIGGYWPYATTIYDYINRAMPQNAPGSLQPNEVYALTAYLLFLNKIIEEDTVINAESLPKVEMPSRHRFIMDDREESSEVR